MYALFVYTFCVLLTVTYLLAFVTHDTLPEHSGEIAIDFNVSDYGFGADKKLLVFDLSEIGSVSNIDLKDKKFAKLTVSDTTKSETYTIGIEIKGSGLDERKKINLAFEIWAPKDDGVPCTSIETCDDEKETLFAFNDKYEDYVLRGGDSEQTLTRDAIPSKLVGGILDHTLVEVLFRFSDSYTYEGVYLLYPAIKRRYLEKTLGWSSKGKAEDCDDSDYDISKVSMIMEHTIESKGRKEPCPLFASYDIKMRYPKCEDYDSDFTTCRQEYVDRTEHFASLLKMQNTTEVNFDMKSFVDNYYNEMLMREDDFPFTSQYFYVAPDVTGKTNSVTAGKLYSGPRWDYDRDFWRVTPLDSFDIYNLNYYAEPPMQIWEHLGQHKDFIDMVKQNKQSIIDNNKTAIDILDQRLQQFEAGYFDRNIARWDMFGKKRWAYVYNSVHAVYGKAAISKKSFADDIRFHKKRIIERSQWLHDNIDDLTSFEIVSMNFGWWIALYLLPLLIVLVTAGLLWFYGYLAVVDYNKLPTDEV